MRRISIDRTMPLRAPALAMLCAMAVGGCVSTGAHTKTLTELERLFQTPFYLLHPWSRASMQSSP